MHIALWIIALMLGWLLLGAANYPAKAAGAEVRRQSLDTYYRSRGVTVRKAKRKFRPVVASKPIPRIQYAPSDTLTPADLVIRSHDALRWPKWPPNERTLP